MTIVNDVPDLGPVAHPGYGRPGAELLPKVAAVRTRGGSGSAVVIAEPVELTGSGV
ncbi:MAG TPA: hypothetical protein VFV66_04600 [Nonomuraea sp.]|nr:hypothetical protein [Nonomuraea sp.]